MCTQPGVDSWPKRVPSNPRPSPMGNASNGTVRMAPDRAPVLVSQRTGTPLAIELKVDLPPVIRKTRRSSGARILSLTLEADGVEAMVTIQRWIAFCRAWAYPRRSARVIVGRYAVTSRSTSGRSTRLALRMSDHQLVLITCGQEEEARLIARRLVATSSAAGVQIVPIESIYRWQGEVVEDHEWLLVIKTRAEMFGSIEAIVDEMHSYEVPPVVAIDISDATAPYLAWIDANVGEGK